MAILRNLATLDSTLTPDALRSLAVISRMTHEDRAAFWNFYRRFEKRSGYRHGCLVRYLANLNV